MIALARSYPKINIALKIGKKCGAKHLLESRFHLCINGIYDSMAFSLSNKKPDINHCRFQNINNFYLFGNFDCDIECNLIYKAYKALNVKTNKYISVYVDKRIKAGAGLGGGSSNAAIALLLFNDMLGLGYSICDIAKIAQNLGSDICFFIMLYTQNKNKIHRYFSYYTDSLDMNFICDGDMPEFLSANVSGVGEIVEPFFEDSMDIRIHTNDIFCSTSKVYDEFDRLNVATEIIDLKTDSKTLMINHSMESLNDLYLPAKTLYKRLHDTALELEREYGHVYFSGSGSSFFSL